MKFSFAAACFIGMALARDFQLADDEGWTDEVAPDLGSNLVGADKFDRDWGVDPEQGIFADPEDSEGFEIRDTYTRRDATLEISGERIYDMSILDGADSIVFEVGVLGQSSDVADSYFATLSVVVDGQEVKDEQSGIASSEIQTIRLEVPTGGSTDIGTIRVTIGGHDAEYWLGTYGAIWKDMDLFVVNPNYFERYTLLDDTSDWHVGDSSAIDRDDGSDGIGKEIQFSYSWDDVWAQAFGSDSADIDADIDWDNMTWLNFDVTVKGGAPDYADGWKIAVQALDASGAVLWSEYQNGTGTEAGELVHMAWDMSIGRGEGNIDSIKVTLGGEDVEYWAGNYGAVFQGMDLYISTPPQLTMLAGKSAASSGDSKNFNAGFVAGFGATTAIMGLAALAMYKRKAAAIDEGAFQRV